MKNDFSAGGFFILNSFSSTLFLYKNTHIIFLYWRWSINISEVRGEVQCAGVITTPGLAQVADVGKS